MPPRRLILIIEDNPSDSAHLADGLRERGWDAEVVADGLGALGRLRSLPRPSAVVLDLAVPTIDGYAIYDELTHNKTFTPVPVVVVTASTRIDTELLDGVAMVMSKPRSEEAWAPLLDDLHAALSAVRD